MTENMTFNGPTDMGGQNHMTMDGNFSHMTLVSVAQPNSLGDLNLQNQIMAGFPVLSMLQGEPINDLQADLNITNRFGILDCDSLIHRNTLLGNSCQISNAEVHERFMNGLPISASSLNTLFAAKCIPHDNVVKTISSNDYVDALKSSFEASMNCGSDEMFVDTNDKWGCNKFLSPPEVGKVQPFQLIGNMELNGLVLSESADMNSDSPSGSSKFSNELSLSLSTCRPSVICGTTIPDQCSDISYSCVTRNPHLGSEQTSCNSKNLSRSFGSYRSDGLSELLYGSKYLHVIQEILAQIACYSLENFDQMSYSALGSDGFSDVNNRFEVQMDPMLQGREIEAKKKQLLALLQVVDDRYNQCLDEIHTVISAFHAATELDPHVHSRFSLQTISFMYKNLRERISKQILAMGAHFSKGDTREEEGSFESSFIQNQWALQQLRRKDHQLWRPQRGLPERSVSVLRAWMFQNFLHPYPKDSEKHLLAVKSGLTRSQVSNWFINARVRLWKPMIEEMYCEMNRRKGRRYDEERDSNCRTHINIENHRFKMN